MFDPILGPADQHSGPAIGDTTEKGDTWHAAVTKINAGFEKVVAALKGKAAIAVAAVDADARKAFAALRTAHDQLVHDYANLAMKTEALSEEVALLKAQFVARMPDDGKMTDPNAQPSALDPDGKPPTGADPTADPSLDAVAAALKLG